MSREPRPDVDADDDIAFLAEVENWHTVLRDTANSALDQDGVPGSKVEIAEDERASLQCAARNLYAIDELVKIVKALPYQHQRAHALMCLCSVMGASFAIGSHASVSETQRVFQHKKTQGSGGSSPRKKTTKQRRRDELTAQCRRLKPRATNHAIAKYVVENWDDEKPPDLVTVQRRLKKRKA
jgi:hypothetical protein